MVASLDLEVNATRDHLFVSERFRSFEVPDGLTLQQISPQQKHAFSTVGWSMVNFSKGDRDKTFLSS